MDPQPNTVKSLWKVTKIVLDTLDFNQVTQKTCDSLLDELGYLNLGYRIIVLSLFNEETQGLQRISLSQTSEAKAAISVSPIPFHDITIPVSATENFCVKAYLEQKSQITTDWKDILSPPLSPEEARINQQAAGIRTSMVFPIVLKGKSVGTLIFSMIKDYAQVTPTEFDMIQGFTEIVGIAVQNAKLYKQLDDANGRLRELDKLKDEFVSLASHELRTPMTAIKSYVWMVQNGKAGPISDVAKKDLDIVYSSTERLIHLINDMLDISRIESGKIQFHPEPLNVTDILHDIHTEFSAKAYERHMDWSATVDPAIPQIIADKDKFIQVVDNLVGNAFKFTPDNGAVSIHAYPKDSNLVVEITDSGRGISAEDIPKLFTKFTRLGEGITAYSQPGTGLGLYLCKQYVELQKGKIWITSEVGKGSTFTFTLPLGNIN